MEIIDIYVEYPSGMTISDRATYIPTQEIDRPSGSPQSCVSFASRKRPRP